MKPNIQISHEFVQFIPERLAPCILYVSIPFATAAHSCFCGCGRKVVTPINRQGWSVTFDGESVSLDPSVGNFSLPCQSHYFIRRNEVVWARRLSREEMDSGRKRDGLLPSSRVEPAQKRSHERHFLDWLFGR